MANLVHNTSLANAFRIVTQRRVLSRIVDGKYRFLSGPFFYVDGQDGTEVKTGGKDDKAWLTFECFLPERSERRSAINKIEDTGKTAIGPITVTLTSLRGHIVKYENDISGAIEQATIIPPEEKCLRLIDAKAPFGMGKLLKLLAGQSIFDVTMSHPLLMPDGKKGA